MTFDFDTAISEGIQRTFTRNGLLCIGVVILLTGVEGVGSLVIDLVFVQNPGGLTADSFTSPGFPVTTYSISGFGEQTASQGTADGGLIPGSPFALAAFVFSTVITAIWAAFWIVGTRVFVSDHTDTIPREFVDHNIVVATLNVVVGNIVVSALVFVGFFLLIIPGVILSIALVFVGHEIAIRDEHLINAMRNSWQLMKRHIIPIVIVGLLLAVLLVLVPIWLLPVALVDLMFSTLPLWLAGLLAVLIDAVLTVLGIAVAARAYAQFNPSFIREHWALSASPSTADD